MWTGEWQNQYGSTLVITDEADERISGKFCTALGDSAFAGEEFEVAGLHSGDCVHFAFSRSSAAGECGRAGAEWRERRSSWRDATRTRRRT